jgi:asparagine synthase (glutamine-hydrolysing)
MDLRGRRSIELRRVERMTDLLVHRGPDGDGQFAAPGIALGHRRLAIVDVAGGRQPMFNETGSVAVVYNGEIYNFADLVQELSARGHRFQTRCDTEVVAHAWEEWGEACVERFRGMFAFALWDSEREALFLARDRVGEKPLYYSATKDGFLVFASELGAVVAGLPDAPETDAEAVEDYFALGYVPDPKSIYSGVFKLPPAHTLCVSRTQGLSLPRRYWDVTFLEQPRKLQEACAQLVDRLQAAVEMRLISDVPLGAFLSGGVDSSGVVAFMAQASSLPVKTCSMGFDDPVFDESVHARTVAARFKTDHLCEVVGIDACTLIDRLAGAYAEPFADSSALPTYLLSGIARKRVTVALSGDGGDEVFAGYRRYLFERRQGQVRNLLPAGPSRAAFGALAKVYPKLDWAPRVLRAKTTLEVLAGDPIAGYFRSIALVPTPLRRRLFTGDFTAKLGGYSALEVLRHHAARAGTSDPVARSQYVDLQTWLPGRMLVKVDRASMANSLEVRTPFLDHELVEWAATLPVDLKIRGKTGKYVLKRALEPQLPAQILYRSKQGFSSPLKAWFAGSLRQRLREVVEGPLLRDSGMFDVAFLRRLVAQHSSGLHDHSHILWALVMFDAFLRTRNHAAVGPRSAAVAPAR